VRIHRSATASLCLLSLSYSNAGCAGTLQDPDRFLDASSAGDAGVMQGQSSIDGAAGDDGASPGPGSGDCASIPQTVFAKTCTGTGCHNSQDKAQGLDLQSPNLTARLVSVPATEGSGLLIDPSTPSDSVLYTKVGPMPPFGARMPLGQGALDDATIACILTWVTQQVSTGTGADGSADPTDGGDDAVGEDGGQSDGD
jgi:hypothetical protein